MSDNADNACLHWRRRMPMALIAFIVAVLTASAQAQNASPPRELSDEQVTRVLMLALDNITRALCQNSQPCAPATAEERVKPPITIPEARSVIQRGVLTSAAKECGLDWGRRNFEPMAAYWRHQMKKNERQMAIIIMMHGIMQGLTEAQLRGKCTDQMRQTLEARLDFKP